MPAALAHVSGPGEFIALALCLARGQGSSLVGLEIAKQQFRHVPALETILRSAVDAGTTSSPSWAGALNDYRRVSNGFLESLKSLSVFDRMLGDNAFRRVPLKTRLGAITGGATAGSVAEMEPVPVVAMTLAADTIEPVKTVALSVFTKDVIKFGGSVVQVFVGNELRSATALETDRYFLTTVLDGATATVSGGVAAALILADLAALLATVNTTANSRLYWICNPADANHLATLADTAGSRAFPGVTPTGGDLLGIPLLVTTAIAAGTIALIDATAIVADSELATVEVAEHASIQMSDSPSTSAANLTSLFQTDSVAIKCTRYYGFQLIRPAGVAVLTGVAW